MKVINAVFGGSAAMVLLAVSPENAQSRTEQLKGDYATTGTSVCVVSGAIITPTSYTPPPGFGTNLVPIAGAGVNSFSSTGVATFNGDGTGTLVGRSVLTNLVGQVAASAADHVIPMTYSVAPDRTLTIDTGPSLNTFVAGPRAGQQNSSSGVPTLVGHVSSDGKSMVFGSFDPAVETLTRVSPPVDHPVEAVRICHRSYAGIRIGRNPGSGDDDN